MPKMGMGGLILVCALGLSAAARADCPPHSHPYDTTEEGHVTTVHCECDRGFVRSPGGCNPSVAPKPLRSAARASLALIALQQSSEPSSSAHRSSSFDKRRNGTKRSWRTGR